MPTKKSTKSKRRNVAEEVTLESIKADIRQSYLRRTSGAIKERVFLCDLRSQVGVLRADFDTALLSAQQEGDCVLMGLDNPAEITPDIEAGALLIAGRPRYLVYFQR
jgi:hypothetical protein